MPDLCLYAELPAATIFLQLSDVFSCCLASEQSRTKSKILGNYLKILRPPAREANLSVPLPVCWLHAKVFPPEPPVAPDRFHLR